jgi:hypothetical protein
MTIRRGVLKSFDMTTYRASVQIAGSLSTLLTDLPVARNIASAEMVAERNVAVAYFEEWNPEDAVVIAVWS